MNISIEYKANTMWISLNNIDGGENHLAELLVDGLSEKDGGYWDSEPRNLNVLNNCVNFLTKVTKDKPNAIVESFLTFIEESTSHREYCDPYVLTSFSSCLSQALKGWKDRTNYQYELSYKVATNKPASPSDIKLIYENIYKNGVNNHDFYVCYPLEAAISDSNEFDYKVYVISIYIQVAYSILLHLYKRRVLINRCECCGRLYIRKRADDKYCEHLTDGKTCLEIRKRENQRISHNKHVHKLYKRIDNRLYQRSEFERQAKFRKEFQDYKTEQEQLQYLERINEETYKRKPKERQDDHGKHETK